MSGTTGPIGLKFCVSEGFGQRVPHTKFQPLRLKDADPKILGDLCDVHRAK